MAVIILGFLVKQVTCIHGWKEKENGCGIWGYGRGALLSISVGRNFLSLDKWFSTYQRIPFPSSTPLIHTRKRLALN